MKKFLSLFTLFILCGSLVYAQQRTVIGKVTDQTGNTLEGIVVQIENSNAGTTTDSEGNFELSVAPDAVLIFNGIGFEAQRLNVGNSTSINVTLESTSQNLTEVVVTALGISKEKRSLGYSTQQLNSDELVNGANTSFAGALQGKLSGVEIAPSSGMPGASNLITIRGARSFTGNNAPLYVVDGMPIESNPDLNTDNTGNGSVAGTDYSNRAIDIDPNDIASIDVLKGQAAAALYGIRASNGVIVITTKSGKGVAEGKPVITFNSTVSFDRLSRYPDLQKTYAQGADGLFDPAASTSYGPKIVDLPDDPNYGGNTANDYTDADGMHPGQYYSPNRALAGLDPWTDPQAYDNVRNFFQTGTVFNNSISVQNGTKNGSYAFSLGSTNQKGIIPHTGMDRYNVKMAAESNLSDHFKADFHGYFINSRIDKAPSANDGVVATVYPAPASYDLKGIPDHEPDDPYAPINYRGNFENPFWAMENDKFYEKTNRFFGNTSLTYTTKFSDRTSLDVKYQIGVDAFTTNYRDLWSYGTLKGTSSVEEYVTTNTVLNSLLTANFNWDINEDFDFSALVGNEIINSGRKFVDSYGQGFAFPGWNHMGNTGLKDASEESTRKRTFGTFASVSLSYQSMLYLTLTGREDRVSTMPRDNRDFFYPSASLGFVFTELDGLKNSSILNYGKLRLSFAQVGQAGEYKQNYYSVPAYGGGFYQITPIIYPINGVNSYTLNSTVYDPLLKPQNTSSYEVGVDLNLFDNRVELGYTFSRQNVKDQIFKVPLAGSTGSEDFMTNGGSIHTNAHEINLNVNVVRNPDWDWSIGGNFSKIDNYVDALAPGVESIYLGGFVTPQVRAGIGDKFPVIYGTSFLRNDDGQIVVDNDGIPIAGPPAVIGHVAPDFILGANTRIRYKMITLSAVTDWKNGGEMYGGTVGLFGNYGISKESAEARDRNSVVFPDAVTENGDHNTTEVTGNDIADYYTAINSIDEGSIIKSSFLKLREVALKVQAIDKPDLKLSVNLFARNLLLWTNAPYLDPEASQGNNNMTGAFERFSLPPSKSFGMGVNIQF